MLHPEIGAHRVLAGAYNVGRKSIIHPFTSLFKLRTYNINIELLTWITDFLRYRKQCVVLNGEQSS